MDANQAPDPGQARTAASYLDQLAQLRTWCGEPSLRVLRRLDGPAPTTTSWVLNGKGLPKLPRWEFVASYVAACLRHRGLTPQQAGQQVESWRSAWQTLSRDAGTATGTPAVPAQLPAAPRYFTGRRTYLARLDRLLRQEGDLPAVVAIVGAGGIGKTALAVRWAHNVSAHFPDGQLHIDLHGYHAGPSMQTGNALLILLTALGIRSAAIPSEVESRAALLRTTLTGRRMLLILDNARDSQHVRSLLPGSPGCFTLVTSRDNLAGLVAREGAHRLNLDRFPRHEAANLFRLILGNARMRKEPGAVDDIIRLCDGLPLAVRVAAQHAADRPHQPLSGLAAQLSDQGRRLDVLSVPGDPLCTVRAVLDSSYRTLPGQARRLFRLLSAHPGTDCTVESAAALADTSAEQAEVELTTLHNRHLLQRGEHGRYRLHDLLGVYSLDLANAEDPPHEIDRAVLRCLDWYRDMLISVVLTLDTGGHREAHWRFKAFGPGANREALAWGEDERGNLLAALRIGWERGLMSWVRDTAVASAGFYSVSKYAHDWILAARYGLQAAVELDDVASQARLLNSIGNAHLDLARFEGAAEHYAKALPLREKCGDLRGEATTLNSLAIAHRRLGRPDNAVAYLNRALRILERTGDRSDQAITLTNLGNTHRDLSRHREAISYLESAYRIHDELDEPRRMCIVLVSLGETYHTAGEHRQAADHHHRAVELATQLGDNWQAATALAELGYSLAALGERADARKAWQRALPAFATRGDPRAEELQEQLRRL